MEAAHFFLRWIHFLAGITWIGILYYFNFVQTPFFAETEASVRTGAIQKLVPRALWWFRWAAMVTFLAGLLMYLMRLGEMGAGLFFTSSYGVTITLGGLIGTIMFLNVWLVIWPNQQIVIASTNQVASGGQALPAAAGAARRARSDVENQCCVFHSDALLYGCCEPLSITGRAIGGVWRVLDFVADSDRRGGSQSAVRHAGSDKEIFGLCLRSLVGGVYFTAVFYVLLLALM